MTSELHTGSDWEQAFAQCPPYGSGRTPYTAEDAQTLAEMERNMEALLGWLESEGCYFLDQYLTHYRQYVQRCCRHYFYQGMLYGTREALDIWAREHSGT